MDRWAEAPLRAVIADRIRQSSSLDGQTVAAVDSLIEGVAEAVYEELANQDRGE